MSNNFVLNYKRKENVSNIKGKWSEKVTLSDHKTNCLSPVIIQHNEEIKILGKQNGTVCQYSSINYGIDWNELNQESVFKSDNPILVKYYSNLQEEVDQFKFRYIYVEISDYIKSIGNNLYLQDKPSLHKTKYIPEQPKSNDLIKDLNSEPIPPINTDQDQIDERIKSIIEDIDSYINDMEVHIKKLIDIKSYLNSSAKSTQEPQKNSITEQQVQSLIKYIKEIESQLLLLEEEKQELLKELHYYNKKIEYFENKLIELKKQYLTLEEIINKDIVNETSLFDKIINYFK